jgi:hypothetical protein
MSKANAQRDTRGLIGTSDDYVSFDRAYPLVTYGKADEFCRDDSDCRYGLKCKRNILTQAQTCRLPEYQSAQPSPYNAVEPSKCTRTPADQNCHRDTLQGRVRCAESECAPRKVQNNEQFFLDRFTNLIGFSSSQSASQLPATQKVVRNKCSAAETLEYLPTGQKVCIYMNPDSNQVERMPDKCCDDFNASSYNHEDEYVRYGLSPQYYGVFR